MNAIQKFAATVHFELLMSSQRPLEPKVKQCLQRVADSVQAAFSKRLLEIRIPCRDDIPKYAPHDGFRAFQFHITFSKHPTASGRVMMALPLEISLDGRNILIGLGNADEKQHFGTLYGKNIKVRGIIELVHRRLAELDAEVLLPPSPLPPEMIFRHNAERHIRELAQENKADSHAWAGVADTFQAEIKVIDNDGKIVLSFPQYKYVDYQNRTKEYEARTVTFVFPGMGYRGLYFLTDTGERRDYGRDSGPDVTRWMFIALIKNPAKQTPASIQAEKQRLDAEEEERSRVTPDTVTNFLKSMRTSRGGRNISVNYYPPGKSGDAWHLWEAEPQNRSRLDHYGNDGDGWDEEGWNESYSDPLSREVQEKLDERFGQGIFEVSIGEKGHLEVKGHPKKMGDLMKGSKTASLIRLNLQSAKQSKTASKSELRIERDSIIDFDDPEPIRYTVDPYDNPKPVVALVTKALRILASKAGTLDFSQAMDFVHKYVEDDFGPLPSGTVIWKMSDYTDELIDERLKDRIIYPSRF
jgi:hypothetical protein